MVAVAEETTLTEEEAIVPTTEPIMAMEGILTTETVADVQAQKLGVAVAHTTVVDRLVAEMEAVVAVAVQEMAVAKAPMAAEVVAHEDQDR